MSVNKEGGYFSLIVTIIFLVFWVFHGLLVPHKVPVKAVVDAGYTEVEFVESHWLLTTIVGCMPLYATAAEIRAKNSNGDNVKLLACSDIWLKETMILHRK
jgi:hypothetical protein